MEDTDAVSLYSLWSNVRVGVLGISERTVRRDWLQAKAWLFRELQGD